jgi:hypothetical protein
MKPGASVPVIDTAARQHAGGASSWCYRRPNRGVERRTARTFRRCQRSLHHQYGGGSARCHRDRSESFDLA